MVARSPSRALNSRACSWNARDASSVRPRPRRAGPFDGSGRGLTLVAAIAARWGASPLPNGKVVWAELGPTRRSPAGRRPARPALSPS